MRSISPKLSLEIGMNDNFTLVVIGMSNLMEIDTNSFSEQLRVAWLEISSSTYLASAKRKQGTFYCNLGRMMTMTLE